MFVLCRLFSYFRPLFLFLTSISCNVHVYTNRIPLFDASSSALDDLYDASQLLLKMNTIQGLATQANTLLKGLQSPPQADETKFLQKCDALLDEFHVPCKDLGNGCTSSDGQSYRLVRSTDAVHVTYIGCQTKRLLSLLSVSLLSLLSPPSFSISDLFTALDD